MKLALALVLMSSTSLCLAAKKSDWKPKYERTKLQELKKKVKPLSVYENKKSIAEKKSDKPTYKPENALEALYLKKSKKKSFIGKLKAETLELKQKAVPTLIKVMKSNQFPEENRWVATYMLGKIMGKKSANFISKFSSHPNWMLRLASLKVLLHLEQKQYKGIYARALEDKSLIVRHQALQNIRQLKIKELAPYVWKMLYNKANYVGMKGKRKRSNIIKDAIKVVGDLGLDAAKKPMLKMMRRKKYRDVHAELDYSLSQLYKKPSPKGSMAIKKNYWNKIAVKEIQI